MPKRSGRAAARGDGVIEGGGADVKVQVTKEPRMKIKVVKVERIEATSMHTDPQGGDGAL